MQRWFREQSRSFKEDLFACAWPDRAHGATKGVFIVEEVPTDGAVTASAASADPKKGSKEVAIPADEPVPGPPPATHEGAAVVAKQSVVGDQLAMMDNVPSQQRPLPSFTIDDSIEDWCKYSTYNNSPLKAPTIKPYEEPAEKWLDSVEAFEEMLSDKKVETNDYGRDGKKSLKEFYDDIKSGKSYLFVGESDVQRVQETVRISIRVRNEKHDMLELKMAKMEGTKASGNIKVGESQLLETFVASQEDWVEAVHNVITLKLGIPREDQLAKNPAILAFDWKSATDKQDYSEDEYPGVVTLYKTHFLPVYIPDRNHAKISHLGLPDAVEFTRKEEGEEAVKVKCRFSWNKLEHSADTVTPEGFSVMCTGHGKDDHGNFSRIGQYFYFDAHGKGDGDRFFTEQECGSSATVVSIEQWRDGKPIWNGLCRLQRGKEKFACHGKMDKCKGCNVKGCRWPLDPKADWDVGDTVFVCGFHKDIRTYPIEDSGNTIIKYYEYTMDRQALVVTFSCHVKNLDLAKLQTNTALKDSFDLALRTAISKEAGVSPDRVTLKFAESSVLVAVSADSSVHAVQQKLIDSPTFPTSLPDAVKKLPNLDFAAAKGNVDHINFDVTDPEVEVAVLPGEEEQDTVPIVEDKSFFPLDRAFPMARVARGKAPKF